MRVRPAALQQRLPPVPTAARAATDETDGRKYSALLVFRPGGRQGAHEEALRGDARVQHRLPVMGRLPGIRLRMEHN